MAYTYFFISKLIVYLWLKHLNLISDFGSFRKKCINVSGFTWHGFLSAKSDNYRIFYFYFLEFVVSTIYNMHQNLNKKYVNIIYLYGI